MLGQRKNSLLKYPPLFFTLFFVIGCGQLERIYYNSQRSEVFVQLTDNNKYDFLFVLDNSGSMAPFRNDMKAQLGDFVATLNSRKSIDFNMAVTDTDYITHAGQLVKDSSNNDVVKSSITANPAAAAAAIFNAVGPSATDFWEQPLISAKKAIETYGNKFLRSGVDLVVVLLSDENDWSCMGMDTNGDGIAVTSDCWGNAPPTPNPPGDPQVVLFPVTTLTQFFTNARKSDNGSTWLFPFVGKNTTDCAITTVGEREMEVATGVGGLSKSYSLCPSHLKNGFLEVAQTLANLGMVFPLSGVPDEFGMQVYIDGNRIADGSDNYKYDATLKALIFTGYVPKKGSTIEVVYKQKNN